MEGLSSEEVSRLRSEGKGNTEKVVSNTTYSEILIRNVVTPLNIMMFVLGLLLLLFGELVSALSASGLILFNVLVSTVQEVRAKRRLDRITLLTRPKVTVVRDSVPVEVDQAEIVLGDIVLLRSGDQALADGVLLEADSLELDESVLTGESSTVRRKEGEQILSGTVCVAGSGYYRITAFGSDAYANRIVAEAKTMSRKKTPIQMETASITKVLMVTAGVLIVLSLISILFRSLGITDMLEVFVLCLDVIPIAMFLLITLTYMLSAVRMADTGVLLQVSSSVESISHVDTLCMDKTGT
ncbi:MAG: HAD-IC family P-type ATPase, partial [Candidatus Methanomethylophilaceae archaeon]|nr:HAD-IC family P-type ATPase [Candidatus Methanomethylophilaceae archaeon]